jgi:hypothetical protein
MPLQTGIPVVERISITCSGFARFAAVLSALVVLLPTPAWGQTSLGPLRTSEQNPLYRLLGTQDAEGADPVAEGTYRLDFSTSYSNVFETSNGPDYGHLFDFEQMVNSLTVRYGFREAVEVGGALGLYSSWGGFLDGFISGFHRTFGLPNGGRGQRPNGDYTFFLEHDPQGPNGVRLDLPKRTFSFENLQLFGKWRFAGDSAGRWATSLRTAVRVDGGPLESGRWSGSAALLARYSPEPIHLHGTVGVSTLNAPDELEPVTTDATVFFSTALEWSVKRNLSLLAQLVGSTSYVKGFAPGDLSGIPLNLIFGIEGLTEGGWGWQVSFAEDVLFGGPSVDFTVNAELSKTFQTGG